MALWYFGSEIVGIRGCEWRDARPGYFLAYCDVPAFGDYEHSAYYYELEPEATRALARANVVFLSNSKGQIGFSTRARREFFEQHPTNYYVLGFGYGETAKFPIALLHKFQPPLKSVVINADPFFVERMSKVAEQVVDRSPQFFLAQLRKKFVARILPFLCQTTPFLCNPNVTTLYRSEISGEWLMSGHLGPKLQGHQKIEMVTREPREQEEAIEGARNFIAEFNLDPRCVVFTAVPNGAMNARPFAERLARALGAEFIEPNLPDLFTRDRQHLDEQSAERWAEAFFKVYAPIMNRCLKDSEPAPSGLSAD